MRKIVIFNGSPRKQGSVSQILHMIEDGAVEKGAQVKVYDLNETGIRGCQGCMYCKKNGVTVCAQNDALKPMYEDIQEADVIVTGSPIYMFQITSQLQTWINRLYPLIDINLKPLATGKKLVTVYSQGNPVMDQFKGTMEYVKEFAGFMGWEEVERIVTASHAPIISPAQVSQEVLDKAYNVGKLIG